MKEEKQIFNRHTPNFVTFPLAEADQKVEDSGVTIPSEEGVKEVKDWVDFKEM